MPIHNCNYCGKVILAASQLCRECLLEERQEVQRIKDFLSDNPGASLMDVVHSTGAPFRTVRSLISAGSSKSWN